MVEIRRATLDALDQILEWLVDWNIADGCEITEDTITTDATLLAEHLNNPGDVFLLAFVDGEPAGMLLCQVQRAHLGQDSSLDASLLYVDPKHRGGSVARRLIEAGMQVSKDAGVRRIAMVINGDRVPAVYSRLGFKQEAMIVSMEVGDEQGC